MNQLKMINQLLEKTILDAVIQIKEKKPYLNKCRIKQTWLEDHISKNAFNYLKTRFSDTENISEVLYRLYFHIETPPYCYICHKHKVRFINFKHGYAKTCSKACTYSLNSKIQFKVHDNLNDKIILNHFLNKNGSIISAYMSKTYLKQHGYYIYFYSRFSDTNENISPQEILYRIKYKIEMHPICPICGKPTRFRRFNLGYREYCSLACSRKSASYYQHKRETRSLTKHEKWLESGFNISFSPYDKDHILIYDQCQMHNPFSIKASAFFNRRDKDIVLCPICNPERNPETSLEQIIKAILDKHSIKYIQHDRNAIKPRELDFYLIDFNVGIECNGIFWHNGISGKEKTKLKYQLAEKANINLITFWEDDIHLKKSAIETSILNICNLKEDLPESFLKVTEITLEEAMPFINENHLGRFQRPSICIGLFLDEKLISVLALKETQQYIFQIAYLCSIKSYKNNYKLLLNYFMTTFHWKEILVNASNELCENIIYEDLGFSFKKEIKQNYLFYNYKIGKRRISKQELKKTTFKETDCYKCYDAGYKLYFLQNKNDF